MSSLEIIDALSELRYEKTFDDASLTQLLGNWADYSNLVSWICVELKAVMKVDEAVSIVETEQRKEDISNFIMEFSALLKELECTYSAILDGNRDSRLDTIAKRQIALHFLLTELMLSRILYVDNPKPLEIQLDESREARLLKELLIAFGIGKPADNVPIKSIFSKIVERTQEGKQKLQTAGVETAPIFTGVLSDNQWTQLEVLNNEFNSEYEIRREMLLKRLDVTIDSFNWADRLADKRETMASVFKRHRQHLQNKPEVKLSDILAARTDLSFIDKTSSSSVRKNTKSAINSVKIGRVPDRGGRPSETQAPPPEMPSWQKRQGGPSGSVGWTPRGGRGAGHSSGRGGGRGGGGRGGYNEYGGGNSSGQERHYGTNEGWNRGGGQGAYDNRQSGHGHGHQGHYGTNEGWSQGGGHGAYDGRQGHQTQYGANWDGGGRGGHQDRQGWEQGDRDQSYRRGGSGGGSNSRVQGGWSNH